MADIGDYNALKTADSTRMQILNAAMTCLIRHGPKQTNISTVASQAGVSRPTVYAHFESLGELLQEAIAQGTNLLSDSIEAHSTHFEDVGDRVVAAFVHGLSLAGQVDVLRRPMSFELPTTDRDIIPVEAIDAARKVLERLIGDGLGNLDEANEKAETAVRLFLSLAAYKRPESAQDGIEGYIRRVALPALGLPS